MVLEASAPPHRRRSIDSAPNSLRRSKRSKRVSDLGGDASSPTPVVNSYKCGFCGKAFPSHQALGGHKASHRIKPPAAAEAKCGPHPVGGRHQCSTCARRFSTGQALGGHMRKHYDGGRKNYSDGACSVVTSSSESVGDFTLISPRNFDLNSPPPSSPLLDLTLRL